MNFDPTTRKSYKFTLLWPTFVLFYLWPTKYKMFELKKYRGVIFNCIPDWYKTWRKTGLCFQKFTWGIWQTFTRALESLQIRTLMAYFCLKLKMYEFKNCRGVMCHGNDKWCKIWRGTDLSVQNWHEEFDEFWPEHSKISKICTLMGFFWTKYIIFELKKSLQEFCLMALNIDATCHISPPKMETPACILLERKRYNIVCSAKRWYILI